MVYVIILTITHKTQMKTISIPKFETEFLSRKLKNGSYIFLFKRKGMPICIRAAFFAGSRFDEIPGTAHFLEHMLVAGSEQFQSKDILAEKLESIGGYFSATTNANTLAVDVLIPEATDLSVGIEILKEILCYPLFDSKTFEKERGSILSEFLNKKSNPNAYVWEIYRRLFMQATLVGRSTIGNEKDIETITLENIKDFYKKHLTSGNLTYVVSGDVDIDVLSESIETEIKLPVSDHISINKPLDVSFKKRIDMEIYEKNDHSNILMGFRTCSVANKEQALALRAIGGFLGGGRSSLLLKRLRYEKGLVYSVNTSILFGPDYGTFTVVTSCKNEHVSTVIKIIKEIFAQIYTKGMTEKELELTKTKYLKSQRISMQTSDSWIDVFENELMFAPENFDASLFNTDLSFITPEKVHKVATEYFKEDSVFIAVCTNKETFKKVSQDN